MSIKKITGTAAVAAALGVTGLGLGAGSAQADPIWVPRFPGRFPGPDIGLINGFPTVRRRARSRSGAPAPFDSPPGHWKGGPHGIPCT